MLRICKILSLSCNFCVESVIVWYSVHVVAAVIVLKEHYYSKRRFPVKNVGIERNAITGKIHKIVKNPKYDKALLQVSQFWFVNEFRRVK